MDESGNFKNTRRKGTDHENSQKNKKERMEKRKRRDFFFPYVEVPIIVCSPLFRNTLVQPSLGRTHLYGGIMPIYMPAFHVM
jgi:hypothetical protein